ncbi:MAG: ATP-binding protein [Myxococcota bacterium]
MFSRLLRPPKDKSFFLFGPRGTGKSYWVRQQFPEAVYIDLLESDAYTELLASPQRLEQRLPPNYSGWVVLDEVQRVPDLLNEVHRLIERRRLRFVLTGSSARKLRRKGVNLLAGRALVLAMHPLTATELGERFDLRHSLRFGQLPSVYVEKEPDRYLSSYVRTYLREEVLHEGLTRNLAAFTRFLEAASFSQANVLNVSQVARDCHVERKVVEDYFTILEDLMIGTRLRAFTRRAKRAIVAHPKFFFFDVGVWRILRPKGPLDIDNELDGAALETLVFQELRATNDALELGYELFFWRTSAPASQEVDFVLYGPRGLKVIEVKRAPRVTREDFRGLRAFLADYSMAEAFLVHGGTSSSFEDGVRVLPVGEFLRTLSKLV